jgi:hypothetical protein
MKKKTNDDRLALKRIVGILVRIDSSDHSKAEQQILAIAASALETKETAVAPDTQMLALVKRFLKYSFVDVQFIWVNLTKKEQAFCTKAEFEQLVSWLKSK